MAPLWRMVLAAGVVAIAGVFLFANTDFTALAAAQSEQGEHGGEHRD